GREVVRAVLRERFPAAGLEDGRVGGKQPQRGGGIAPREGVVIGSDGPGHRGGVVRCGLRPGGGGEGGVEEEAEPGGAKGHLRLTWMVLSMVAWTRPAASVRSTVNTRSSFGAVSSSSRIPSTTARSSRNQAYRVDRPGRRNRMAAALSQTTYPGPRFLISISM